MSFKSRPPLHATHSPREQREQRQRRRPQRDDVQSDTLVESVALCAWGDPVMPYKISTYLK